MSKHKVGLIFSKAHHGIFLTELTHCVQYELDFIQSHFNSISKIEKLYNIWLNVAFISYLHFELQIWENLSVCLFMAATS